MPSKPDTRKTVGELVAESMREIVAREAAQYIRDTSTTESTTMTERNEHHECPLTTEDEEIIRARMRVDTDEVYMIADRIDARAMLAIEVDKERRYRDDPAEFKRNPGTPADRVELWGDQALRLEIEAEDGEPLL
jgi:hypothetical protein